MEKFEKVTGMIELEDLKMESQELDENGGATPSVVASFIATAISADLVTKVLPTSACSSKC